MNKWIPISLFVFLGIYLLTTAQATVFDYPAMQIATSLSDQAANLIQYVSR